MGNAVLGRSPNKQRGHRNFPHAAPRALEVPGGGEVCKSAGSVSRVCPGLRRPQPSAGNLAFGDLTRDLVGLGEESKGESLSMIAATCPLQWPTEELWPNYKKRQGHPAAVAATWAETATRHARALRVLITHASSPGRGAALAGPWHLASPSGFKAKGHGCVQYRVPSSCPS